VRGRNYSHIDLLDNRLGWNRHPRLGGVVRIIQANAGERAHRTHAWTQRGKPETRGRVAGLS